MEQLTEEEISLVLDTYMYMGYHEAQQDMTVSEAVTQMAGMTQYQEGGAYYGEFQILSQASQNAQIGKLKIRYDSYAMGFDTGTNACTFVDEENERVFVAYRGTGDGEWLDNGLGLTQEFTTQQQRAVDYFDRVVWEEELDGSQRVVVTGHSKGGNKAAFVTMESSYGDLIDRCYSVDGQGFSESAIARWKRNYTSEEYEVRTQKLYGVYGENDFVSPLGKQLIAQDHITYIRTPVEKSNLAGYHDVKYLFAVLAFDEAAGAYVTFFSGRKNEEVTQRGDFGNYVAALSDEVMKLPVRERSGAAAVLMQIIESASGRKDGLNGEKITCMDFAAFVKAGIPAIVNVTLGKSEGGRFLGEVFFGNGFLQEIPKGTVFETDYGRLGKEAENLKELAESIRELSGELKDCTTEIPWYMMQKAVISHHMVHMAEGLQEISGKMDHLSECQTTIARHYADADVESEEIAAVIR